MGEFSHVNQNLVQRHLGKVVRSTVEETLTAMLGADADRLRRTQRYEHSPDRVDTRAGHYERQLHSKAGEVTLRVPKLRSLPFETAIIRWYRRRETSVAEALLERYYAGVSPRRVGDITEALWGTRVVGAFPDRNSALLLVSPRLRHIAGKTWGSQTALGHDPPQEPAARLSRQSKPDRMKESPLTRSRRGKELRPAPRTPPRY